MKGTFFNICVRKNRIYQHEFVLLALNENNIDNNFVKIIIMICSRISCNIL